jgi:hypothetical protein
MQLSSRLPSPHNCRIKACVGRWRCNSHRQIPQNCAHQYTTASAAATIHDSKCSSNDAHGEVKALPAFACDKLNLHKQSVSCSSTRPRLTQYLGRPYFGCLRKRRGDGFAPGAQKLQLHTHMPQANAQERTSGTTSPRI